MGGRVGEFVYQGVSTIKGTNSSDIRFCLWINAHWQSFSFQHTGILTW